MTAGRRGLRLYFFNYSTWLGRPGIYLEDLFVEPELRGLGIGKALLERVAAIAVEKGCQRLEWAVLDWNTPAIEFYRAMGAEFHGRVADRADDGRGAEGTGRARRTARCTSRRRRASRKVRRLQLAQRSGSRHRVAQDECNEEIRVIGGGLAGPEAALTAARLGCEVELYEMRAVVDGKPRLTPAHQTTEFGELVCSNSLKSESPNTAPWLLKQEMRRAGFRADAHGG